MSQELESQFEEYVSNNLKKTWCKKTLNITFIPGNIKFCMRKEKLSKTEVDKQLAFELERYGIVKTVQNEYIRILDSLSMDNALKFGSSNKVNPPSAEEIGALIKN